MIDMNCQDLVSLKKKKKIKSKIKSILHDAFPEPLKMN